MRVQNIELTHQICPTCNGLGVIGNGPCERCEGSGEEEVYVCASCGEEEQNCTCFPAEDLPVWCGLDPAYGSCPAPEEEVKEAIENLLISCRSCPYAALAKRAA